MRIGIDYTAALSQGAGIGRYTRELVGHILQADPKNTYLLVKARGLPEPTSLPPNATICTLPMNERFMAVLWHRARVPLPLELFTGTINLFHSPDFVLPPLRCRHTIVTIHDMSFLVMPECALPSLVRYLTGSVPRAVLRADVVVAVSHSTKADLVQLLGVNEDKVVVGKEGVGDDFSPVTDEVLLQQARATYVGADPFILNVGTLEPRKNQARLIQAYHQLIQENGIPHRLAIVGRRGWLYENVFAMVERLQLKERVLFLGHVPDQDLPALYSLADIFVYPSLYEGFGMPPLEAMACGTPVVASNVSSLPEVLGDAALLVDPTNVTELAQAMFQALTDQATRQALIAKGFERAKKFTWVEAAQQMLGLYHQVGGG